MSILIHLDLIQLVCVCLCVCVCVCVSVGVTVCVCVYYAYLNPIILQATCAAAFVNKSSQTVPHMLLI